MIKKLTTTQTVAAFVVGAFIIYGLRQPLFIPFASAICAVGGTILAREKGLARATLVGIGTAFAFIAAMAGFGALSYLEAKFGLAKCIHHLPVLVSLLVAAGFGTLAYAKERARLLSSIAAAIGLILAPTYYFLNRNEAVVSLQIRNSLHLRELPELPKTVEDRLLPRPTAEAYMHNLNDEYMTSVESPHLQLHPEGKLNWQAALYNNTWWGSVFGSINKVLAVEAARTEQHVNPTPNSSFLIGDKSWLVKAVFAARHPFSEIAQSCYFQKADGSWSLLISYTSESASFSLPAPGLMIPSYGGVMEVTQEGWFRDWSPKSAAAEFKGAVLYPVALMRRQAEAYARWHDGWNATKVLEKGVLKVSEDAGPDAQLNPLPYVQHYRDLGLQLTVPLEPKGDKQYAFVELLLADAATGQFTKVVPPKGLIGPRQARLAVRTNDSMDWSSIRKIEPMLVVNDHGVFWRVSLIAQNPGDNDRYPYMTSILVDAVRGVPADDHR